MAQCRRALSMTALAAALAVSPVAATGTTIDVQMVTNTTDGFTVGVPIGWQFASDSQPDYVMADPAGKGFCAVNSVAEPSIDIPNDQLRAMMAEPQGESFWNENVFGDLVNKTYVSVGADAAHPGGWPVQTVIVTSQEGQDAQAIAVTRAAIATIKSQQSFLILCIAETSDFEAQKPYFNAVFQSFRVMRE